MGALTSFNKWNPQDDLLLKNAVEAGASLESLAKGAVNFSRRITVRELEDRWRLLLYDLNTSTEASARIIDIEIGVSAYNPSKPGRACNSKLKESLTGRRKVDSLQCHYYAARKKARSESHRSANFDFLVLPGSHVGTDSYLNNQFKWHNEFILDKSPINVPSSDNYLHLDTNYAVSQDEFHGGMVGSVESELPDGILGRDCSFANLENISCIPIDQADLNNASQRFEANISENEFPCALDRNHCSSQTHDVPESRPTHNLALNNANANVDIEVKSSRDFSSMNGIQDNVCCALGGNLNPGPKIAESCSTFNQLGYSSSPPGLPIWKTIVEDATPTLPMDAQFEENDCAVVTMEHVKKMDHQASDDVTPKCKLNDGTSKVALDNSSILSEDNFIEFSSPGLTFTDDEDEVLLFDVDVDVDVDDFGGRSCLNGLGSILLSSPTDNQMDNLTDPGESRPSEALDTGITACKNESSMEHEAIPVEKNVGCGNLDCSIVPGVSNVPSSSRASPDALVEKLTICVLNTEDLDVPCNDDVSFPAKLFQAFATTNLRQNVSSTVTNDGKAAPGNSTLGKEGKAMKLPPNMANFKAGQSVLPKVGLLQSTTDGILDPMLAERDLTSGAFGNSNVGNNDANLIPPAVNSHSASDLSLKQEATIELKSKAVMPKCMPSHLDQLGNSDPLPTMSVSDQEEQPSENDFDDEAPSFSDIEAMILDMDLGPYDMESSLFTKEVSRYQCMNTKRTIIRLEQGAQSYMNRTISSQGAFAIFYGRHLKYLIRTPEVLLGRETEDIKVDIDLGKEGRANKISRRQAIIKMDEDGCFHLKNIGKSSIFVNSKEVPVKKRINLCTSALIEIKDMRFIFEVNEPAVKHHITSLRQYVEKPKSEFDFGYT